MTEMGDKIRALRKERGMTLEELGDRVGVGKSTVRKWENGMIENMRRDKIAKIAQALGVSPAYLMGWKVGTEPIVTIPTEKLSAEERVVIRAYRDADPGTRAAVKKLLDVNDIQPIAAHAQDGSTQDQLASDADLLRKAAADKKGE